MTQMLDERRFEALLDLHGAEIDYWPIDVRDAAHRLLASSADARHLLQDARLLDDALDGLLVDVSPPLGLKTRIVASTPPRDAWLDWLTVAVWRPVALACLPLMLGFAFGANVADDTADLQDQLLVAFADSDTLEAFGLPEEN